MVTTTKVESLELVKYVQILQTPLKIFYLLKVLSTTYLVLVNIQRRRARWHAGTIWSCTFYNGSENKITQWNYDFFTIEGENKYTMKSWFNCVIWGWKKKSNCIWFHCLIGGWKKNNENTILLWLSQFLLLFLPSPRLHNGISVLEYRESREKMQR